MIKALLALLLFTSAAVAQTATATFPGGSGGGGSGTVTSIATTSPITGGTITSTGTIACATCVTSAAALTANQIVIGGGSQASAVTTTGTGVLTALGVNVGSAGAFVPFNGALGTPSSGTLTNATGLPIAGLANIAANTMLGNWTAGTTAVSANTMPSCADTGGNHLNYVNGTGVTCGTSSAGSNTYTHTLSGNVSAAAWTTTGIGLVGATASFTDTSSSGTVANMYVNRLGIGTILASSATTYTNAYGLWVEPPTASTNVTMTTKYAIGVNGAIASPVNNGSFLINVSGQPIVGIGRNGTVAGLELYGNGLGSTAAMMHIANNNITLNSGILFGWSASDITQAKDTILSRNAAGIVQVGTTVANSLGTLLANTLRTNGFAVASLPTGVTGARAYVTDQMTACPTLGGTFTGGGAVVCGAFYDGTAWTHQ